LKLVIRSPTGRRSVFPGDCRRAHRDRPWRGV